MIRYYALITSFITITILMLIAQPVKAINDAYLTMETSQNTYNVGDNITVDLLINSTGSSIDINSLGLRISFNEKTLQYNGYVIPTTSLYSDSAGGLSGWKDDNTGAFNNKKPNLTGILLFEAANTTSQSVSTKTPLLTLKFKIISSGSGSIDYQFNKASGISTSVIGPSAGVDVLDQSKSTGMLLKLIGKSLPETGLFDHMILSLLVGVIMVISGMMILRYYAHFEKQDFAKKIFSNSTVIPN